MVFERDFKDTSIDFNMTNLANEWNFQIFKIILQRTSSINKIHTAAVSNKKLRILDVNAT